jgi:hypothetical protein
MKARRQCAACLTAFRPIHPDHAYCKTCWEWARIGAAITRWSAFRAGPDNNATRRLKRRIGEIEERLDGIEAAA